eukprot:9070036-Alexandrium_andersonii.AAC.1
MHVQATLRVRIHVAGTWWRRRATMTATAAQTAPCAVSPWRIGDNGQASPCVHGEMLRCSSAARPTQTRRRRRTYHSPAA